MNARPQDSDDGADTLERKPARHSWSEKNRELHKTRQVCWQCGVVKVTHHQTFENVWNEYFRGGAKIEGKGTPICTGVKS